MIVARSAVAPVDSVVTVIADFEDVLVVAVARITVLSFYSQLLKILLTKMSLGGSRIFILKYYKKIVSYVVFAETLCIHLTEQPKSL